MSTTRKTFLWQITEYSYGEPSKFLRAWAMTVAIIGGVLVIVAGAVLLARWTESRHCEIMAEQTQISTEYRGVLGGCFIDLGDGTSVPIDEDSIGLILRELSDNG